MELFPVQYVRYRGKERFWALRMAASVLIWTILER